MLKPLIERFEGIKPQVICVEAAHIYANETPDDDHFFCAEVGSRIVEALSGNGTNIVKMLFVDDYHPSPEEDILNLHAYISKLEEAGFAPDTVITESSLAESARRLLESLNGQTVQRDGKIYLNKPNLFLVAADGTLSCTLLDAVLYMEKFKQFDFSVTVLSEAYKGQQKNVRKFLKVLGYETVPVANVYYDSRKEIKLSL